MAIPPSFKHALDMLPHLASCAKNGTTITYGELGKLIGHPALYLSQSLDVLRDRILIRHHLPRLDAVVVGRASGEVGDMFHPDGRDGFSNDDFHDQMEDFRKEVYAFARWDAVVTNILREYGGEAYRKTTL